MHNNQYKKQAVLGIGANLGNAQLTVQHAILAIAALSNIELITQSDLYKTTPIDSSGDDYINAVLEIETDLSPLELLHILQSVEQEFGRERPYYNAPRSLDIDILLYESEQINTEELCVPHPRMSMRAFVLIPLLQILPNIVIPGIGPAKSFVANISHQGIMRIS